MHTVSFPVGRSTPFLLLLKSVAFLKAALRSLEFLNGVCLVLTVFFCYRYMLV